jgi:hypothetical protein
MPDQSCDTAETTPAPTGRTTPESELPPLGPLSRWTLFRLALMRGSRLYSELARNHPMK